MSIMIAVPIQEIEQELCEMINEGLVKAKINRVTGLIKFKSNETSAQILNSWANGLHTLLNMTD